MTAYRLKLLGWPLVLVLFAVAGLLLVHDYRAVRQASLSSPVGRAAPNAVVMRVSGGRVQLLGTHRHPTWLNFFATWCVPCKTEMPQIERLHRHLSKSGLVVVGVDQQESSEEVTRFTRTLGLTFDIVLDEGNAASAYRVFALPTSVFIDADGVIRAVHTGVMTEQQMDDDIGNILPAHQSASRLPFLPRCASHSCAAFAPSNCALITVM